MRGLLLTVALHVACVGLLATAASAYEITGVVVDADGAPIEGATVWLNQQRTPRVETSDPEGRFAFGDLVAAPVDIVARKEGLALGGLHGQVIDNAEVTITLRKGGTIRLRMINTQYEPVAGARLKRLEIEGSFTVETEDLVPLGFPSVRSDSEGNLTVEDVPMGVFMGVTVSHRDYADATLPALPAGMEISMPMVKGMKLRGRITNESEDGVERARISVFRMIDDVQHEIIGRRRRGRRRDRRGGRHRRRGRCRHGRCGRRRRHRRGGSGRRRRCGGRGARRVGGRGRRGRRRLVR